MPVDGFYEWQDQGKGHKKQPFYITARDGQPLALAGCERPGVTPPQLTESKATRRPGPGAIPNAATRRCGRARS